MGGANIMEAAALPAARTEPRPPAAMQEMVAAPSEVTSEAVKFDLAMAKMHGSLTLAYLARAGWRLAHEKQSASHGEWLALCEKNIGISSDTATRYIKFYYSTVGEHLRAQGAAHRLVEHLTDAMIEEATAGLESKTATGAMIELGIVKRPPGWGGAREGAGRRPAGADVAAELKAVTENEAALWSSAKGSLDVLVQLDSERGVFHRLSNDHLATAASLLADISKKAAAALEKRLLTEAGE